MDYVKFFLFLFEVRQLTFRVISVSSTCVYERFAKRDSYAVVVWLEKCVCTFYTFGSNLYTCIIYILKLTFTLLQCKFTFFIPKTCCIISYFFFTWMKLIWLFVSNEWLNKKKKVTSIIIIHGQNNSILTDKIPESSGLLVVAMLVLRTVDKSCWCWDETVQSFFRVFVSFCITLNWIYSSLNSNLHGNSEICFLIYKSALAIWCALLQ